MQRLESEGVTLGQRVQRRLSELDMTQADLARRSGLSTGYVSNIINGQRGKRVSADVAHRLAGALKLGVRSILGKTSHKQNASVRRRTS